MKAKTELQLSAELSAILNYNKEAFLRMFAEDVMGIKSNVADMDLSGKVGTPKFTMHGMGCSVAYMDGKGAKGKKYARAAGSAIMKFKDDIRPTLVKLYPNAEVMPALAQDYTVNEFLQHQALKWFRDNSVTVYCTNTIN